ncbi:hypothetical protein ABZX39_33260 [Streptomyces collinus]|uniref:hypothetical protein n=1 Tax=Streptomyces collinus TaxID=42684 RepID=UPI0033ACBF02
MTEIVPTEPVFADNAGFQAAMVDAVSTGRNIGAGAHIAGLLTAAQVVTAPTPAAALRDLHPEVDPAVLQDVYNRGVEVGWRGHAYYQAPRLHGEELEQAQAACEAAGFEAMRGMVARSRVLAARSQHPGDGEIAREH